ASRQDAGSVQCECHRVVEHPRKDIVDQILSELEHDLNITTGRGRWWHVRLHFYTHTRTGRGVRLARPALGRCPPRAISPREASRVSTWPQTRVALCGVRPVVTRALYALDSRPEGPSGASGRLVVKGNDDATNRKQEEREPYEHPEEG